MYHCHIRFCFAGRRQELFEPLREMPPLEAFSHEFLEEAAETLETADAVFADLSGQDTLASAWELLARKQPEARLVLLAEKEQAAELAAGLGNSLSQVDDIWVLPLGGEELRFRFLRWQRQYKEHMDRWESDQFLEVLIDSSPNMVWYKTKDGVHEKVNNSFCQVVGKTKQQVQGQRHAYIWDVEQDDPACIESERIVMESRQTCVSEETVLSGAETKLLTTYKSPLYDADGSVMGTLGVAVDISKERAYADELIEKNQTLEALFTTMDCGIMRHTLDGSRIISINQAALDILGYDSEKELLADGFFMVASSVAEEDRAMLEERIASLKNPGDNVSLEYRVHHRDGELLHVMGNVKLVQQNGELFYQRYLLDCTALKMQEEQRLQEQERRQMGLIQALSTEYSLVCYFDLNTGKGRSLRINECENNILNDIFSGELVLEECISRYIDQGVHEEDRELLRNTATRESLEQVLSEKAVGYLNFRTTCCGWLRYFQMKVVRAGNWDESHGVVLGFRSVDEETREEREKKALLEDALSQANRASRAKSTFLSNMSHDIRTPMNAIIGFTSLAATHIDNKEQVEEYLKKIMTSGNHLLSLINDVLDMSRIESGKIRLEEQPCSLPEILHGLRNIIQADIQAKQLDLYMDAVDIQDEEICCDRLRLNQVLLNLLSNAVKYTGPGGMVSVKVVEKPGAPAGYANYEFHVKDSGIGMDEEFVAHIFEPFERERNSTISGIQGTGLGMAITKNIVELMNGTIQVNSKQNVGTECIVSFTFQLSPEKKEPQAIPELNGLRALVVDDDFNTCDSVSWMLQQIGMRAEWTLSGKEAVLRTRQAVTRADNYSVYIIDWLLPDMNGVEVARRVRQEMDRDVPIIVLTAYDWSDIEEEAREAGVSAFCSKPMFFSDLRGCLNAIVSKEQKPKQTAQPPKILRTGHILLAEDNELNREIATALLEEAGFSLEAAENGQIALDMLKAAEPGHYQLVLMDIQMPVMDGYEAAKAIRQLENRELASIPILAMTANAFEEDKQEAIRSGMDGHIAKPIDVAKLMETLDQVLGQENP